MIQPITSRVLDGYYQSYRAGRITIEEFEGLYNNYISNCYGSGSDEDYLKVFEKDIDQRVAEKRLKMYSCDDNMYGYQSMTRTRKQKQQYYYRENYSYTHDQMVNGIAKAIRDARSIAAREHIKAAGDASRHERVGIFVTCLRQHFRGEYSVVVTNKALWYDIGRLNTYAHLPPNHVGITMEKIQNWMDQAYAQLGSSLGSEADARISYEIDSLKLCCQQADVGLSNIKKINADASQILQSLRQTLQEIQ